MRFDDHNPVHRDTDLAHVGEGATRGRCRRFFDVGVIQDYKRTLSAEFERQALQRVGSRAHDRLSSGGRSGRRDHAHVRMRGQCSARLRT